MKLNISEVNMNEAATYQYTITYNNSIYTANIIVTENQKVQVLGPDESTKKEEVPIVTDQENETNNEIDNKEEKKETEKQTSTEVKSDDTEIKNQRNI